MESSFRVQGRSERFDEADPAWLDQFAELFGTMTHFGVPVSRESAAGPKGALETIVVALSSADGIWACGEAWRAWLGRDSSRWIEITGAVGGGEQSIILRASDLMDGRFDPTLEAFAERFRAG
jgi:hypothetical protein